MEDVIDDDVDSDVVRGLREDDRAGAAHLVRVAIHHREIGAHQRREIGLDQIYPDSAELLNVL